MRFVVIVIAALLFGSTSTAFAQSLAQYDYDPSAHIGAFVIWSDAGHILRLSNCQKDTCGIGEIPVNWLSISQRSREEREIFPYDTIVLPSDGFQWYWTALKFHWQFIARR